MNKSIFFFYVSLKFQCFIRIILSIKHRRLSLIYKIHNNQFCTKQIFVLFIRIENFKIHFKRFLINNTNTNQYILLFFCCCWVKNKKLNWVFFFGSQNWTNDFGKQCFLFANLKKKKYKKLHTPKLFFFCYEWDSTIAFCTSSSFQLSVCIDSVCALFGLSVCFFVFFFSLYIFLFLHDVRLYNIIIILQYNSWNTFEMSNKIHIQTNGS